MSAEPSASRTAIGVATLRAAHQLIDDEPHVLDDPLAVRLLGPGAADRIRARADDLRTPRAIGLRAHVVLRSRFAEDRLAESVARGVTQYVQLGAGFDTSPYRLPPALASLRTFEVDHPASQQAKRAAVEAAGIAVPATHVWVPADLERDDVPAALQSHGFDDRAPTFVSCLGVLIYLADSAADAVIRFAASLPRGSEFVFTFARPATDEPDAPDSLAAAAGAVGEPWRWRPAPELILERLRDVGFHEVALVSGAELDERYTRDRRDGLRAPHAARLGWARV